MSRLFSSGFEEGITGAQGDWAYNGVGIATSTNARNGSFCGNASGLVSGSAKLARFQFSSGVTPGPYFTRVYFRANTLPTVENTIFMFSTGATSTLVVGMTIDQNGVLRFYDSNGVIGNPSSALSLNQYYRLEMSVDGTPASGSRVAKAFLNGLNFASQLNGSFGSMANIIIGGNLQLEAQTTGNFFFDDFALNDNTGSYQTDLPGAGAIVHLRPSVAGDNNMFTTQVGGTAGASNNFTRVKETQPDLATSYNADNVLNDIDDFNIDNSPASITTESIINLISVGVVHTGAAASANSGFKVRCKKTSSGTVSEGTEIVPSSTTWKQNITTTPTLFPLTLPNDPDGNAWTKTTLDSAQIGYRISTANTNNAQITAVYMLVDFSPSTYPSVYGGSVPNTYITKTNNVIGY